MNPIDDITSRLRVGGTPLPVRRGTECHEGSYVDTHAVHLSLAVLKPVEDGVAVVACSTCRHSAEARDDAEGWRGGARLIEALQAVQASDPAYAEIAVQAMPCLFACQDFCTVHLRAPTKVGYVLGRFEPTEEAARAILDYARLYGESAFGQVPFKQWPQGVKGHFITRTPPAGFVVE